ncbi:hypothetical protein UFOVP22_33 [uncultured Caudovirales phage]|uniref:S-adenosyl-L-methionine-dependent methyltransferase n=1 Tax=uncultured Caudovirales phage TaxID=2100421 RepID=A0A6J5T840_9CAUD|nr:hypothetical protein UFOVP22_33 [uncultured Caudovirales phage]
MKVLIACEYSGVVRDAFIDRGYDAISCDLLPTDNPGPHHQGDIIAYLNTFPNKYFDLIIAHPECTKLCVSGNRTYGEGKPKHNLRLESAKWTEDFWELCKNKAERVAFENPVGVLTRLTNIPKANYIQPYQFGHLEQKKTGLHLYNLDKLQPTNNLYSEMMLLPKNIRERLHYLPPSPNRWKIRSTTYSGIAEAMARQWGTHIELTRFMKGLPK